MEVRREQIRPRPPSGIAPGLPGGRGGRSKSSQRVERLNAHQLLRGGDLEGSNQPAHLEGEELERYVQERVLTTTLDKTVAWARSNSFFPLGFGLACCAMEQFHAAGPRMDIARFGFYYLLA
ncbi:MAG: hypothetical protein ACRDLF_10695 [Solirubrobacteraceae bacterium]